MPRLVVLAVVTLAAVLVPAVMTNGLASVEPEHRPVAQRALTLAEDLCVDHPITAVMARRLRVTAVAPVDPAGADGDGDTAMVRIRVHTWFGLPVRAISVQGGSLDCKT